MATVCTKAFARCCHGNCSREDRCRSDEAKDWIPSNTLPYRKAFHGVSLLRKGPSWFSCALNDKGETYSNPIPRPLRSAAPLLLDNLSAASQYKDDSSKFPAARFPADVAQLFACQRTPVDRVDAAQRLIWKTMFLSGRRFDLISPGSTDNFLQLGHKLTGPGSMLQRK